MEEEHNEFREGKKSKNSGFTGAGREQQVMKLENHQGTCCGQPGIQTGLALICYALGHYKKFGMELYYWSWS